MAPETGHGGAAVGVLALQGDFAAHARVLESLGTPAVEIRKPDQLAGVGGLILPGGESTTLLKLMDRAGFGAALRRFHAGGGALFGTCAGLILLARRVTGPEQSSLGLIDVDVERNAYGRQIDSFETTAEWTSPLLDGGKGIAIESSVRRPSVAGGREAEGRPATATPPLALVFIRAPRIRRLGDGVEPLARCRGDVVLARQGRVLVASFHPEMTADERVHRTFVAMVRGVAADGPPTRAAGLAAAAAPPARPGG